MGIIGSKQYLQKKVINVKGPKKDLNKQKRKSLNFFVTRSISVVKKTLGA